MGERSVRSALRRYAGVELADKTKRFLQVNGRPSTSFELRIVLPFPTRQARSTPEIVIRVRLTIEVGNDVETTARALARRNWNPRLIFLKDSGTFSEMDGS